jgi:hypothetical protein
MPRRGGREHVEIAQQPCPIPAALSSQPMHGHLEIISGGQTGVDRGALDAALELGMRCSGWCPEGRNAEDGRIPDRYPLSELKGADYPERTRRNVEDSDATLIIHHRTLSGGTQLTLDLCRHLGKPVCLVDAATMSAEEGARIAGDFVTRHGIRRLNVAGPRASHWSQAHDYAQTVVRAVLIPPTR